MLKIPAEVLLKILKTWECDVYQAFIEQLPTNSSLDTLLCASLVSKNWNRLARKSLYSIFNIEWESSAAVLLNQLNNSHYHPQSLIYSPRNPNYHVAMGPYMKEVLGRCGELNSLALVEVPNGEISDQLFSPHLSRKGSRLKIWNRRRLINDQNCNQD